MPRGQRTSRIWIVVRAALMLYVIMLIPCILLWLIFGVTVPIFLPPSLPAFLGCLIAMTILMGGNWIWTNATSGLLFHDDPEFQQWRRDGFDPYFDNLPPPFNNDSWAVRLTGQEEAAYDDPNQNPNVDANGLATKPCPSCQASVKEPWAGCFFTGVRCWNCQKAMRACPSCFKMVGEPVVGGFSSAQGVRCPFCGTVMRM